jgi:heat shock protein HtpX
MNQIKTFTLLAAMTALFMCVGYLVGGAAGTAVALMLAAVVNLLAWWRSDAIVLAQYRAQPVDPKHPNPMVRAYAADVIDLAGRAGLPAPAIYVIDNPQPNAFATGRDPRHGAVVATTGLLQMLARDEVRAVMAHELAHIRHRDTLTMTVTATLAGAISMAANLAFLFGPRGDGRQNPVSALALMILAPIAAALVQMAISRSREYEADAGGAAISGDPGALARALSRIEAYVRVRANEPAERNPATAHLFIVNPLGGGAGDALFATHPSTANRVARLSAIAGHGRGAGTAVPVTGGPPSRPPGPWG